MTSPMDSRTLTALEGSIKKWEAIVAGTGGDEGTNNCPLCKEFADIADEDPEGQKECFGCPVSEMVGRTSCGRTPYVAWASTAHPLFQTEDGIGYPWKATTPQLVALAQAELDFLKSLRPGAA